MTEMFSNKQSTSLHYDDPFVINKISDNVITSFPRQINQIIVLCIGTDRSTGDSLGPLTGTLLHKMKPKYMNIYGTLPDPVHAINLETKIKEIQIAYNNPFIIAIDASLGKSKSIGCFQSGSGSIVPGAALNKNLPAVGDAFITGVVNVSGLMEFTVLQSTRLSLVYEMAMKLSKILFHIDIWLQQYNNNQIQKVAPSVKINNRYTL